MIPDSFSVLDSSSSSGTNVVVSCSFVICVITSGAAIEASVDGLSVSETTDSMPLTLTVVLSSSSVSFDFSWTLAVIDCSLVAAADVSVVNSSILPTAASVSPSETSSLIVVASAFSF